MSLGFESLFFRHGLNRIDEGWPLYAAKLLHEGGTLYRDVFFVFPPGHLLAAWLGWWLDPPGVLFARGVYIAFNVAACVGIYLLGRRVMPAPYALFGALLLAIGAPASHLKQLLFGYRYLAIAMLGLLAFARRLDTGRHRWTFAAGIAIGACLAFRLTPALATAAAITIGVVVADRRPGTWLRDVLAFGAGVAIPALPVLGVLWLHAGLGTVWLETVVRPVAMVDQQGLPIPSLSLPDEWTRRTLRNWFVGVQYRGFAALYAIYVAVLGARLLSAIRRGEHFRHAFLLTLVAWGAIYFLRTLGRSDEPHLDSALPPTCLLVAHAVSHLRGRLHWPRAEHARRRLRGAACAAFLAGFAFLTGSDFVASAEQRGRYPLASTGGSIFLRDLAGAALDWCVENVRRRTLPGDTVLDLSASPLVLVLADRSGPGGADIVMPGTFLSEAEERRFVARLERSPPALVIWPKVPFDRRAKRGLGRTAPLVSAWVEERYEERARRANCSLRAPKGSPAVD